MTDGAAPIRSGRRRRLLSLLPLLLFVALAVTFAAQLLSGRDNSVVPSALLGQKVPSTNLPALEGSPIPGIEPDYFAGEVTILNVWASWCAPCREEHPLLMQLAADGRFRIAGLNYKDQAEHARRFLGDLGNPYDAVGTDQTGRTAIDWGVYGVPETFVVGKDETILFKHVGPLTREVVVNRLLPEIERALAEPEADPD